LAAILFVGIIHFRRDWLNAPGNDFGIILTILLWLLSVLTFFPNAIAHIAYGKKTNKIIKGIIITFLSFSMIVFCSIGIWVMMSFIFK
jgi:hypothetical protein